MLVLNRNTHQTIHIGDDIVITLIRAQGQQARIAIEAPKNIKVLRGELLDSDKTPAPRG